MLVDTGVEGIIWFFSRSGLEFRKFISMSSSSASIGSSIESKLNVSVNGVAAALVVFVSCYILGISGKIFMASASDI